MLRRLAPWQRTLYALWFAQTLTIIGFNLRTPFLPLFLAQLGATDLREQELWAGAINAGGAAIMAVAAPIWGTLADRHGRKLMVLRAMAAGSITITLMALATAPWQLFVLRLIEGAFTGTVTASTTLAASISPRERLGFSLGLMQMAVFSGSAIGPLIGGALADTVGYRLSFALAGSLLFLSAGIVLFLVHEDFHPESAVQSTARENSQATLQLLMNATMGALVGVLFVARCANTALQPILPIFIAILTPNAHAVNTIAGLTLGIAGLTSAIASVVLGRTGDRIGPRPLLLGASILGGLSYLPLAFTTSITHLVVLQGIFGIALGGILPTANALIAQLTPPERRGAIYGFTTTATALGGFIGPLAGTTLAATISLRAMFLSIGSLLLATSLWLALALPRTADLAPAEARKQTRSSP